MGRVSNWRSFEAWGLVVNSLQVLSSSASSRPTCLNMNFMVPFLQCPPPCMCPILLGSLGRCRGLSLSQRFYFSGWLFSSELFKNFCQKLIVHFLYKLITGHRGRPTGGWIKASDGLHSRRRLHNRWLMLFKQCSFFCPKLFPPEVSSNLCKFIQMPTNNNPHKIDIKYQMADTD